MHVLIIGAGLGGLCLAHGLRAAGVRVTVFERGTRDGAQPASYGIHMNADGLRALHAALPAENWARFDATSMPAKNVIHFLDPVTGPLATLDLQTPEHATDPVTHRRAVTRGNLRDALLHGLDDGTTIRWDARFERYEQLPDGRIQAHFADGTAETGDLLVGAVGADGANSRVRAQRHPGLLRQELDILNVAGRVALTPDLERTLPAELTDSSINNYVPAGAGWMFVSTWRTGDSAIVAPEDEEPAERYIIWAWCAPIAGYPNAGDLTAAQLKQHVEQQIVAWAPNLRNLVRVTRESAVGPVPLRTMPQLPEWAPNRVTLLGDAIHNMTPMGGIGANTALRDADALRAAILTHPADPEASVRDYEARMRIWANEALRTSTRNAQRAADPRPGPRRAFRTILRVADRVPAVERRIFHTPRPERLARA